jgi:hypothetical protein
MSPGKPQKLVVPDISASGHVDGAMKRENA